VNWLYFLVGITLVAATVAAVVAILGYHQRGTARLARAGTWIEPRPDHQGWQAVIRVHNQGPGDAHNFEAYQSDSNGKRVTPDTTGRVTIQVGAYHDHRFDLARPRSETTLVTFGWSDARGTRTQTVGLLELPQRVPDASHAAADVPT
jgi:hypothetical protein